MKPTLSAWGHTLASGREKDSRMAECPQNAEAFVHLLYPYVVPSRKRTANEDWIVAEKILGQVLSSIYIPADRPRIGDAAKRRGPLEGRGTTRHTMVFKTSSRQEVMEVLTGPERRWQWSAGEKAAMVRERL